MSPVTAEEATEAKISTIRVQGEAVVTAKPDQAVVTISVITQDPKADGAAKKNAQKADLVIQGIRKVLSSDAEIKTIGYSVTPDYRYPKEGGEPKIVGYTASNMIEAKTSDLDKVGDVIDSALAGGANNISGLQFRLKDEAPVAAAALEEAARRARSKAEAIANALKVRVVRVLKVEEGGLPIVPVQERMVAMAQDTAQKTPVEAGTIEVSASITLTVEIQ